MNTRQPIIDASGLIGLLLVFAFGYFAAVLPVALSILETPRPDIAADRSALSSRIVGHAIIVGTILVLDLLVGAWLTPLTIDTIRSLTFANGFPTIEVGLLIMDLFLISLLAATIWLLAKLLRRSRAVR